MRTFKALVCLVVLLSTASLAWSGPLKATVRRGDNLLRIARKHGIQVEQLRTWNRLESDRIYPGQELVVSDPSPTGPYTVRRGDTLGAIARRHDTTVARLREWNGLRNDRIHPGQELVVREPVAPTHTVRAGDALWEIASTHGMSVYELKALNGLDSSRIFPGQVLRLAPGSTPVVEEYEVRRGDTLGEIAQLHQMTVSELRKRNGIRGSVIHPGQVLQVKPMLGASGAVAHWLSPEDIDWASLHHVDAKVDPILASNGPYYYGRPRASYQKTASYFEGSAQGPRNTYRRAAGLWQSFEQKVDALGRLSRRLEGWHFVLDPGHGGVDPGAIVSTRDGNGNTLYVVEDEYVYDIALRVYVLLRLHGAEVTMTLLSPNHLLRDNHPATRTFVHEKNEVFNSRRINESNRASSWPRGGRAGLAARVDVAEHAFSNTPPDRRVFVSLHADNSTQLSSSPMVLYYSGRGKVDRKSREFARRLLPSLGAGAHLRGQNLGVLRNNPAGMKVLVELRNLAYTENAWALRFEKSRQRDAEKLVKALLDAAS